MKVKRFLRYFSKSKLNSDYPHKIINRPSNATHNTCLAFGSDKPFCYTTIPYIPKQTCNCDPSCQVNISQISSKTSPTTQPDTTISTTPASPTKSASAPSRSPQRLPLAPRRPARRPRTMSCSSRFDRIRQTCGCQSSKFSADVEYSEFHGSKCTTNCDQCTRTDWFTRRRRRSIDGSPVDSGNVPWQANVQHSGDHRCGGALISMNVT